MYIITNLAYPDGFHWTRAVFNLSEGIDVLAVEAKVSAYERNNWENIAFNEARKVPSSSLDPLASCTSLKRHHLN